MVFDDGVTARRQEARCPVDRSWCAQRCCDGAATESLLRRSCADQMLRAALLRRSYDGVAAAKESLLRRSWRAAQTSSVALILRVSSRRDALNRSDALNEEPASFSPVLFRTMVVAPTVLGHPHPPGPVISNINMRHSKVYINIIHIYLY